MAMRVFRCPKCGNRFRSTQLLTGKVDIARYSGRASPSRRPLAGLMNNVDLTCPNCGHEWEVGVGGIR